MEAIHDETPKTFSPGRKQGRLREVALYFLRLGMTAFGGPAAHIGMMHQELVQKRKWVDEQHFLDLLGATNLIPGPNSTEMTIHLGYIRAGWPGLIVGGVCFILPAMLIVMGLAGIYIRFGTTPAAAWLLYAVKPVIIAVILDALIMLGQKAVKGPLTALVGIMALAGYFMGVNEIVLLFAGGALVGLVQNFRRTAGILPALLLPAAGLPVSLISGQPFSLAGLFLVFLKIGAVLYGSGYVLLAFLRADLVQRLGWLSDTQLIDAIAVGQVTPGPVFTTATFIGYILGGVPGAVLATVGIFLPAFIFVALSNPLIPRIRQSRWASSILDGINVSSLGLMAAVTWQLGRVALVDWLTFGLAGISIFLIRKYKLNSVWLVLGGLIIGILRGLLFHPG